MYHLTSQSTITAVIIAACALGAHAAVLEDGFDDGDRTNNPTWYLVKAESSAPVVNDPAFGGNAMQFNNEHSGSNPTTTPFAQKGVVASFDQVQLLTGESLVLSFDFRLQSVIDQSGLLRFGLGRNATDPASPTPFTADGAVNGSSAGDDDPFYLVALSTGANTGVTIREDNGTGSGFLAGADFAGGKGSGNFTLNDTDIHQFSFTVERTSDTEIALSVDLDGNTIASGVDDFNLKSVLNEVGLVSNHRDLDFVVDNVTVTFIPEPGSAAIGLLGVLLFSVRRRS